MLTDYSKIKPKSLSRLANQSFWIPTESGLIAYMKQRKLLAKIRISSSNSRSTAHRNLFQQNNSHMLCLQNRVIRQNSAAALAEKVLNSNIQRIQNISRQMVRTHNAVKLHFSSISKPSYNIVENNAMKVQGNKVHFYKGLGPLKKCSKQLKIHSTIEHQNLSNNPPLTYQNFKTLPQDDNEDNSNSDISTAKLESKYKEYIPDPQDATLPHSIFKRKVKLKAHKSHKS